jgi:hypothetical protein
VADTAADPAADTSRRRDRMRRRRIFVLAIVAVVVVASGGAFLLTTAIKSPAQQAAQTQPPPQTRMTAPVVKTVLTTTVLAQAAVDAPREFTPSVIGGGSGAGGSGGGNVQQIVTRIFHRAGDYVGQGSVLFEIAGRPFFVFQGTVPAYRDLRPGETGTDVTQLQDDLASLGYGLGGDTLGVFGRGTSAAIAAYYQAIGYTAPQVPVPVGKGKKTVQEAMLPLGEYSFVPRLPARIAKLGAAVGSAVKGGGLLLALGSPVLSGQLSPSNARLIRPGMKVTITEPGTGATIRGRVTSVAHVTSTTASISGGLYVHMGVRAARPLPLSDVGQDVSLTIAAARSSGAVLAVPEAAVFAGADGGTYVSVVGGSGALRKVAVRVGMSGSGLLQVTPLRPGTLAAGDRVLIGAGYAGSAPGGIVRRGSVAPGKVPGNLKTIPAPGGGG